MERDHDDVSMKKFFIFLTLLFLAASAFADSAEGLLRSFQNRERPLEDCHIIYQIGAPNDFLGMKKVEIFGNGDITVEHRSGGEGQIYQGQLSEETLYTLINEMLESRFWQAKPGKDKKPYDSADIQIKLSTRQNDAEFGIKIGQVEASLSDELHTLVKFFNLLIVEVSSHRA